MTAFEERVRRMWLAWVVTEVARLNLISQRAELARATGQPIDTNLHWPEASQ